MTARRGQKEIRRVLMTVDAVGGVWRYAIDLASGLQARGIETVFVGLGPPPSAGQVREAEMIGTLAWLDAPLDWMVDEEPALESVPRLIADLAAREDVDLLHLNLPSQAAGLDIDIPVVVASHSCVVTWFAVVRGCPVPQEWSWQHRLNRKGFDRADAVLAPTHSHAAMLVQAYGHIDSLHVVYNVSRVVDYAGPKEDFVFAAGRWWDEGKNGSVLDVASLTIDWPVVMIGSNQGPNGQCLPLRHARHDGTLSHHEAMAMVARAAIVVSPSLYEPFGLAALEAARSRSALVLADIPTYRELWDGASLFADPRDPVAVADAVNRLSRDAQLRKRLAEEALARSQELTVEAQVDAVKRIFSHVAPTFNALTAAE